MTSPAEPVSHPLDLLQHLRIEHRLTPIADNMPRDILELAHVQRHDGYGVGADHPRDHSHRRGGFQ